MALIVYKQVWTLVEGSYDEDAGISFERYAADTWRFDTNTRTTSYLPYPTGGSFQHFPGFNEVPADISLSEAWGECLPNSTTRRAYLHNGDGTITPQDDLNAVACGFGALRLERVTPFAPAQGTSTGRVQIDTAGGQGAVTAAVLGPGPTSKEIVLDQNGFGEITGLPTGSYILTIFDSTQPTSVYLELQYFTIPVAVVAGCTDRNATNYNSAATFEDGSCVYQAPVRTPVFRLPLLNPLRFVIEQATDNSISFETLDNVLFCQQHRPGQQLRPLYREKVQSAEAMTVQVHTDYSGALTAEIRRHGTSQLVRSASGSVVQRHTGLAAPLAVALAEHPTGGTRLTLTAGPMPLTLRQAVRVVLGGAASGTYRVKEVVTTEQGELALVLIRPWTGPVAGAVQVQWQLSGVNFNVWEVSLNWAGLAEGDYYVRLQATDATAPAAIAVSEPVWLAETHENTVVVEYANRDNAYGMVWTTGITPRLRLPGTFFRRSPAGSSTVHRSSSGAATLLSSSAQRRKVLETAGLPDWLHEKLFLVFRLDSLRVQGQPVFAEGDYEAQELRAFPLYAGAITLELRAGFGTGNSDDNGAPLLPASPTDNLLELRTGGFLKLH